MVRSWEIQRSWKRANQQTTHSCLWTKCCKTNNQKLHDTTAITIAMRFPRPLMTWELWDIIAGLCFDATALNTGAKGGEWKRMEEKIERKLLHLAATIFWN